MTRRLLAAIAPLAAAVVLAAPAPASTVSVLTVDSCNGDVACSKYAQGHPVPITVLANGDGEDNRVEVTRVGAELVLRDTGALLRAQAPCSAVDANTARCPVTDGEGGIPGLRLTLGSGADTAVVGGLGVESRLMGGDGNDALTGGDGNEEMDGGPGDDALQGGSGFDVLSYAGRVEPVAVDLAAGTGGGAGERDTVGGFETVAGGAAADRLHGGPANDVLDGGDGDDRVDGAGGADELFGGKATDRLTGGAGADRLYGDPAQGDDYYYPTFPYGHDRLDGGAGDDQLHDTGGRNVFRGGAGDDVLEGGVGPDRLYGGGGADTLYGDYVSGRARTRDVLDGGPGGDRIDAVDGLRDVVRCGTGLDRARTDRADRRRGCERRW